MPAALRNYLLRLGWSYKDKEIFTLNESIECFNLKGIGKSPSKLDISRILSMNEHYIKNIDENELFKHLKEYCSLYKKKIIPEEISKAKGNGKKIIIALGYQTVNNWFESYTKPLLNWTAQINFLEDIIKLSRHLNNTFIILRLKGIEWTTNTYFKSILDNINDF